MIYHIRDYITDPRCASAAVREAFCDLSDGDTLSLDGMRLEFYPDDCHVRSYHISNNDAGEKPIAFPLICHRNVTIDGEGADLVFHGRILPFCVDRSEHITIKNLSIDYASAHYSQAEIVASDEHSVTLRYDGKEFCCRVKDGNFGYYSKIDGWEHTVSSGLTLEFEKQPDGSFIPSPHKPPYFPYTGEPCDHGFLRGMYRDVTLTEEGENLIKMTGNFGFVHTPGNMLITTHASREFPGIFITESLDTTLSDITLYYTTSMGVIGQLSDTITLCRVKTAIREGSARVLTVNADAPHFVNCRGKLTLDGCRFTNMMDDACNIHGIYGIVNGIDGRTLKIGFGHFQQRGIRFFREGDTCALIEQAHAKVIAQLTVTACSLTSPDEMLLTLDGDIPTGDGTLLVENLTSQPEVHAVDCESGFNRPRGFLLSSAGKITIERCRFYNMNCGLQIGGEMKDWYESGAVTDVTVRNCDFTNSAYAGGAAIHAAPKLAGMPDKAFHGKIVIENNKFVQHEPRILYANLVDTLIYRNNSFTADASLPAHSPMGDAGFAIANCTNTEIEV